MSLPVTVPNTFANSTVAIPLSNLDNNFTTITNSINGLTNGASKINVASITATGTANSSTYLRGDGAWANISGGGTGTVTSIDANSTIGFSFTGGPVTSSGTLTLSGPTPGTSGNILTSNGTAWVSQAAPSGSGFSNMQIYTSGTGAWTIPAGVTKCKITVVGGGAAGGTFNATCGLSGGGGGAGGASIKYFTGLTPLNTLNYTVGAAASTTSVSSGTQTISTISATGGTAGAAGGAGPGAGGAGGLGSGGTLNIQGGGGGSAGSGQGGVGGSSIFGGGGRGTSSSAGVAGGAYGGGGSGSSITSGAVGAGSAGVIIIEY